MKKLPRAKKTQRSNAEKQPLQGPRGQSVFMLDPDEVVLVTDQAHKLYDPRVERPVDAKLKARIVRAQKVRQPIKVFRDADGQVLVVAGRGRVKALREINQERRQGGVEGWLLPCLPVKGHERALLEEAIDENDARTGDNPIEHAVKVKNYVDLCSEIEAADFYDCSVATIKQTCKLLTLERELQDGVAAGVVSVTTALSVVGESREAQLALLEEPGEDAPAKIVRPTPKKVEAVAAQVKAWAPENELANVLILWALGEVSDATLAKRFPHLATDVLPADKKTKKAAAKAVAK